MKRIFTCSILDEISLLIGLKTEMSMVGLLRLVRTIGRKRQKIFNFFPSLNKGYRSVQKQQVSLKRLKCCKINHLHTRVLNRTKAVHFFEVNPVIDVST